MGLILMVLGFMWWWPLGLIILAALIANGRFGYRRRLQFAGSGPTGDWDHVTRMDRIGEKADRVPAKTDGLRDRGRGNWWGQPPGCRRVMTIPGIGPIISSAMIAAIGSGAAFARGRDFSAWIGLVPKQMSTGDRAILGRISKRGNGYLRMLFMQAAQVILLRPASWPKHGFGVWLAPPSASIPTFWPRLSPTSWHGSPGRCWRARTQL